MGAFEIHPQWVYFLVIGVRSIGIKNTSCDNIIEFEHAWEVNPTTCHQPIIIPPHVQEIDDMAMWGREAICNNQVATIELIDEDFVHLLILPSFTTLIYRKMKAYGHHFCVDNEFNNTFVMYEFGVAFVFQQSQGNDDEVLGMIQYVQTLKEVL